MAQKSLILLKIWIFLPIWIEFVIATFDWLLSKFYKSQFRIVAMHFIIFFIIFFSFSRYICCLKVSQWGWVGPGRVHCFKWLSWSLNAQVKFISIFFKALRIVWISLRIPYTYIRRLIGTSFASLTHNNIYSYTNKIKKCIFSKHTCIVLMCLSLNLSSTYRRTRLVLPTHPSPSKTTLNFLSPFLLIVN